MAGTKEIKRRIKSVKNTKKITKAMELVAASKMKRAVSATTRSRFYAMYSWDVLTSIAENIEVVKHPLFEKRESVDGPQNILLVLVTSNRGLCGAYNSQVIKKSLTLLKQKDNTNVDIITVGKKGDIAVRRVGGNVVASFFDLPANISLSDVSPIADLIIGEYNLAKYNQVCVLYTDFISALTQKPHIKQILPISKDTLKELLDNIPEENKTAEKKNKIDYTFEGDKKDFIGKLAEKLTKMQIYQMLLESNASEQSARMMAMKNASEASGEMIDDLTLVFNKARQSNITREISEISAGMASMS